MRVWSIVPLLAWMLVAGCNTRQRVAGAGAGLAVVGLTLTWTNENAAKEDFGTQGKVGVAMILTGVAVLFVAAALDEMAAKEDEQKPREIRVSSSPTAAPVNSQQQEAERRRKQAWDLTKQAQEAARTNDCAKVTELSAQIGALDAEFYADIFMKDVAIQRCFVPADQVPAEPAPPVPPPVPPAAPPPAS